MEQEIWKDIPGYEGKYQASTLGRIKSLNYLGHSGEKILSNCIKRNYYIIGLYKDGKNKKINVHRLIATTFLELDINSNFVVHHKDSNGFNNRIDNLEIVTIRENCSKERVEKKGLPVGVYLHKKQKNKKYRAFIYKNKKSIYLGQYNTSEEASNAYQTALKELNQSSNI